MYVPALDTIGIIKIGYEIIPSSAYAPKVTPSTIGLYLLRPMKGDVVMKECLVLGDVASQGFYA
jgi:hypothetical protein